MEAKDLIIDSYVYFNCLDGNKLIVKVTGYKDGIVYGISKNSSHSVNINKVEPILLTPKIMEKMGFNYIPEDGTYGIFRIELSYGYYLYIYYDEDNSKFVLLLDEEWEIKYLHQLQYLIRILGYEKEPTF